MNTIENRMQKVEAVVRQLITRNEMDKRQLKVIKNELALIKKEIQKNEQRRS